MARFQHISGKRRVFVKLRQSGTISRAELARQCSLTRPAVSAIIDELMNDGIVRELGPGHSTGGKPPIMLEFKPASRCAIGIDLGGARRIEGVLCDLGCGIIAGDSLAYENNFDSILQTIFSLVRRLVGVTPGGIPVAGVGIAVSAIVGEDNDVIGSSTLDIIRKDLARKLESLCGLPVRMERRPNAAALAEALFGAGQNHDKLLYLTSGRGIGAGMVIGGEIFRGCQGFAGELGRLVLPGGGQLEEMARPTGLPLKYSEKSGKNVNFEEFMGLYLRQDETAVALVRENARQLAYAAQVAANIFDPNAIVLGGDVLEFGDIHFNTFKDALSRELEAWRFGHAPDVLRSAFGRRGVAVGGAQLILDELIF